MARWGLYTFRPYVGKDGGKNTKISVGPETNRATQTLDVLGVPPSLQLFAAFRGYNQRIVTEVGGNTVAYISRKNPMPFGFAGAGGRWQGGPTGLFNMYVSNIDMSVLGNEAADTDGSPLLGPGAMGTRMEVTYTSQPWLLRDDSDAAVIGLNNLPDESKLARNVVIECGTSVRLFGTGRFSPLKFAEYQTGQFPGSIDKLEPRSSLRVNWMSVPAAACMTQLINPSYDKSTCWLDLTLGHVNSDTFAGYPFGQLLLVGIDFHRKVSAIGDVEYDVVLQIDRLAYKHNRIFWTAAAAAGYSNEGGPPGYLRLSMNGTYYDETTAPPGALVYDPATFQNLFRVY